VNCRRLGRACDQDTRRSPPALLQTPPFEIPRLCYPSVWWTLVARGAGRQRSGSQRAKIVHSARGQRAQVPGTCARRCLALVFSAGRAGARSLSGVCMLNVRVCACAIVRACVRVHVRACSLRQVSNIAKDLGSRRQYMGGDMAHRRQTDNRLNR